MSDTIPKPDYAQSIEFLRRFHPGRRWCLTAIKPKAHAKEKPAISTATFDAGREAECLAWLQAQGESRNLYFSVAEPIKDLSKKAERTDLIATHWLHVDVDPRAREDLSAEQARILALLRNPPAGVLPPTVIVFSGGGYGAFWRLREPLAINGDLAKAEDAARYNKQLELLLGGDNCHNVDRIMRLPGTVNRPDYLKVAKGRTPELAAVVKWLDDAVYDLGQFAQAPAVPSGDAGAAERPKVRVTGEAKRLASVDELPMAVSRKAKVVIVQGLDPDEPNKFTGRSEWLFYACCEMVRGGCGDDTIYAVITDPKFGISASVLDKGSMVHKYAVRQIERAKDFGSDDPVSLINRQYFAVLEGKRIIFYREEDDKAITAMNADAFSFATAPVKVTINGTDAKGNSKPIEVEAAKVWRSSGRRRFYGRGFVLDPTHSHSDDEYNLWKGFGVEPTPGDWSLMRRHIETALAAGDLAHADYIIKWAAWTFQNPATPPRVALVFRGDEGTGKGVFGRALVTAFGTHGQRVQNISHVAGRFNAHMRHCCMFFADEVSLVSDDQEGNLKGMITEPTIPIEAKGVDVVHAENHLHVVMASNREFMVPAGIGARRFAMFDVPPTYKGNHAYWQSLYAEIDAGGIAAMLHDLLALPLGSWHPETARPDTKALSDQKLKTLPALYRYWWDCLQSGVLPFGAERTDGKVFLPTSAFAEWLNDKLRLPEKDRVTTTALGLLFRLFDFEKDDQSRPRGWNILPLTDARKAWDEKMKLRLPWGNEPDWQITTQSPAPQDAAVAHPF